MDLAGKFIVFDGPDGSGKGTQIQLVRSWIESSGTPCVYAKDPGGTAIGDRIRHILLGYDLSEMAPRCETLLFMASRAQLVAEVVRPALEAGRTVLGDRFISATLAYQGALGVAADLILDLGRLAVGEVWPHLTIVLDVPPELGFRRTGRSLEAGASRRRTRDGDQLDMFGDTHADAMELRPIEFHERVRARFQSLADHYPRPVVTIDATRPPEAVFESIRGALERAF